MLVCARQIMCAWLHERVTVSTRQGRDLHLRGTELLFMPSRPQGVCITLLQVQFSGRDLESLGDFARRFKASL